MECHWSGVREECLFDLCGEATRDRGKLVPGSIVERSGSFQLWAGKHRRLDDGTILCSYTTRPRPWNIAAQLVHGGPPACKSCGRPLTRVIGPDAWEHYVRRRARQERRNKEVKRLRAQGYKPWYEPGRHRTGPGGAKGRFWDHKHIWERAGWTCLYTTRAKAWKRERWASRAKELGRTPCSQCGRPLPTHVRTLSQRTIEREQKVLGIKASTD